MKCLLLAILATPSLAQVNDAAPVNTGEMLNSLKQLRELNQKSMVTRRNDAIQRVTAAAATGEKAAAFWKEAVKAVQFEGAKHENAQIRNWKEGDGEALGDKHCQNAARLHLYWLGLTLRRSAGAEIPTLLPNVIEFVKQVQADEEAADHLAEQLKKARESKHPGAHKIVQEDSTVRRVHDDIMRLSVAESPVARWLRVEELIHGAVGVRSKRPNSTPASWENTPGDVIGIYNSIILPEFRATKDQRLLEYWDMVLRRETARMAERTLDVEQREWLTERRPTLLWQRAQDVLLLGQKNKAIGEMFNIVKTFPSHPEATAWMDLLQNLLAPAADPKPEPVPSAAVLPPATPAPAK